MTLLHVTHINQYIITGPSERLGCLRVFFYSVPSSIQSSHALNMHRSAYLILVSDGYGSGAPYDSYTEASVKPLSNDLSLLRPIVPLM